MMSCLWRGWGKSTFVVMMVVVMNSAAIAQFGNKQHRGHGGFGMGKVVPGSGSMVTATGQTPSNNLYEALKSQNVETTLTGAQLTSDWHIISSGEMGIFAMFGAGRMMPQLAGFTKGRMVSFGNDKYLVAYYVQDQGDLRGIDSYNSNRSKNGYLFKDSLLSLSLLPLNGNQSFYEIKKFDPAKDYISRPVARRGESLSNLKQIALAIFMYTQDYDETLPPMVAARSAEDISESSTNNVTNSTSVQNRLMRYIKSKEIFLQPVTKRPYLPNYKVSRLPDAKIKNPTTTFLFYEDAPDVDGMRCVAFADGHAKALTEAEFQKQRKAQGISESGYPSAAKPKQKAKESTKP